MHVACHCLTSLACRHIFRRNVASLVKDIAGHLFLSHRHCANFVIIVYVNRTSLRRLIDKATYCISSYYFHSDFVLIRLECPCVSSRYIFHSAQLLCICNHSKLSINCQQTSISCNNVRQDFLAVQLHSR
jgi:hypothetical protein